MRKALIAAVVASALFAVGAFAAEFSLSAEDIASGEDDVLACADEVRVTFPDATWNGSTYVVANAAYTFYETIGDATPTGDCDGITATVLLERTVAADVETDIEVGLTTDGVITLPGPFEVKDIEGAAVLIENISIDATTGAFTAFP